MNIDVFDRADMPLVLRTLRTALRPEGALDARERLFLDTYAHICGVDRGVADPLPIAPGEVKLADAQQRKRLVQLAAVAVLHAQPIRPDAHGFLKALARQLAAHDSVVDVVGALLAGRTFRARLLSMRRGLRMMLKEAYLAEGPMGVLRFAVALAFSAAVNRDKAWRYRRLGLLPEGTLGRHYWNHMMRAGFGFPGEPAGIPDAVAYHDVLHVLADHDATPQGEIQQGAFQAGNRREDGFFFLQMVLLQFHQGVQVTPVTPGHRGHFAPDRVLWAIHRGAKCNVDMTHQWNFWSLMELPLSEARARVALLPKLATAGSSGPAGQAAATTGTRA